MSHGEFTEKRFKQIPPGLQVDNPYDMSGPIFDDLKQRKIDPVKVLESIDLSVAGERLVRVPGRALVIYGHDGTDIKTINTTAFVNIQFEREAYDSNVGGFPMKHARGFRGPFTQFVMKWPAQAGVFVDVVVHQFEGHPWIDGESAT